MADAIPIGERTFEEILLPHETMIRTKGSKVIMTGYHYFHGVKAVANKYLMQDICVIISDLTA